MLVCIPSYYTKRPFILGLFHPYTKLWNLSCNKKAFAGKIIVF